MGTGYWNCPNNRRWRGKREPRSKVGKDASDSGQKRRRRPRARKVLELRMESPTKATRVMPNRVLGQILKMMSAEQTTESMPGNKGQWRQQVHRAKTTTTRQQGWRWVANRAMAADDRETEGDRRYQKRWRWRTKGQAVMSDCKAMNGMESITFELLKNWNWSFEWG